MSSASDREGESGRAQPGRPERLTREALRAAALRVADEQGADKLSMRGVARACGVTAMALYRHVDSLDQLRDLVVDTAMQEFDFEVRGDWRSQICGLANSLRRVLLAHPGAAAIWSTRHVPGPTISRAAERALEVLTEAGFEGNHAVIAYDSLVVYTLGAVIFEVSRAPGDRQRLLTDANLPEPLRYLRLYAPQLAYRDADRYFATGLDALVEGLAAQRGCSP